MNEGWRVKLVQAFAAKRNDECIFSLYALKTAAYVRVPCASTLFFVAAHSPLLPQHLSFLSHIHLRGHFRKYLLLVVLRLIFNLACVHPEQKIDVFIVGNKISENYKWLMKFKQNNLLFVVLICQDIIYILDFLTNVQEIC